MGSVEFPDGEPPAPAARSWASSSWGWSASEVRKWERTQDWWHDDQGSWRWCYEKDAWVEARVGG